MNKHILLTQWQITAIEKALKDAIRKNDIHYGSGRHLLTLFDQSTRVVITVEDADITPLMDAQA